jgi:hypothetical protein
MQLIAPCTHRLSVHMKNLLRNIYYSAPDPTLYSGERIFQFNRLRKDVIPLGDSNSKLDPSWGAKS